jgi:hypothetical protein
MIADDVKTWTVEAELERLHPGGLHYMEIFGCDPGPEHSALVRICVGKRKDGRLGATLAYAAYPRNRDLAVELAKNVAPGLRFSPLGSVFLAIEKCGQQGCSPGEDVFETASMYGEIRQLFRPLPTYAFRSSEWRHALTGIGNAGTPMVYEEATKFFEPIGGGSDPYKGVTSKPGPLWALHQAGKGGNVEHLKDALGVALGLTRIRFRSGVDPEAYRREW